MPHSFICDVTHSGPTCTLCAEGKYQANTAETGCDKCASGKYLDATGQDAEGHCKTCPANSGNNLAASTAESDCRCSAGWTGLDGGVCWLCAAGTYKAGVGNAACTNCGADKYSTAVGQIAE